MATLATVAVVTLPLALAACADDAPAQIAVVAVAATPCDRPTARLGVGTAVGDGLVITAAHVVEDDLRELRVDGRPATVVAIDARIDVAVLAVELPSTTEPATKATLSTVAAAGAVRIVTPTAVVATTVERVVMLDVDDATDRAVHRRRALVLAGAVPSGTSGAPVVDAGNRVVGVVTVSHAGRDVTYATVTTELLALIDGAGDSVTRSSLAAVVPCA